MVGVTAQLKATLPVNPPDGVTVTVEVPLPPGAEIVIAPLLASAIDGVAETAFTVTGIAVDMTVVPLVPVTCALKPPRSPDTVLTVMEPVTEVTRLKSPAGCCATEQVGNVPVPVVALTTQLRVTTPVNPFTGVTVTEEVALFPAVTVIVLVPATVKLGGPVTVRGAVAVSVVLPLIAVTTIP